MTPAADVLDVALQLSKSDRARVAEALLESLEDEQGQPHEDAPLEAEIERRMEAFRLGQSTAENWRVVMGRIKSELESRRP